MSVAPRHAPHNTVHDYQQWQGDWELIGGVAFAMNPSPFGLHERVVSHLVHRFMSAIETQACDCQVYAGLDWIVGPDTVVRPDVMVVSGDQPDRHLQRPPELIVEVLSPSTVVQDRTIKRDLYLAQGVSFYLMVDLDQRQVEILDCVESSYRSRMAIEDERIQLPSGCVFALQPSRLPR